MVASVLAISVGGISNDTESGNRESGEHDRAQRGAGVDRGLFAWQVASYRFYRFAEIRRPARETRMDRLNPSSSPAPLS